MNKKTSSLLYTVGAVVFLLVCKRIPFNLLFEYLTIKPEISYWLGNTGANFFVLAFACWAILVRGRLSTAGINNSETYFAWSYLLFIPFFFLFSLNGIVNSGELLAGTPVSRVFVFVLYIASIALVEELLFRGFIQSELLSAFKNKRIAILIGAVIFGLAHLSNFTRENISFQSLINQVYFAGSLGFLMGAVLYKTRNIWPIVVYHFLVDFFSLLITLNPEEALENAVVESTSAGEYPIASIIATYVFYSIPGVVGWLLLSGTKGLGRADYDTA
jgi:membrane protease YdiL (CAAX protease family)